MKQNKEVRNYHVSDARMLVESGVFSTQYKEDESLFMNYSPKVFSEGYGSQLEKKIDDVYYILGDDQIKKNLARLTQKVNDRIREISVAHGDIIYFARLAFPGDQLTLEQMGDGSITEFARNHDKFQLNVNRIGVIFNQKIDSLVEAGCTEERISQFLYMCKQLVDEREEQQNYMITRKQLTRSRIRLLNEIFDMMVEIHEAALRIWYDNREQASRYDLPYPKHEDEEPSILNEEEVQDSINE